MNLSIVNDSNISSQTTSFQTTMNSSTFYSSLQASRISNTDDILVSESALLFWICVIYAVSVFIYGLLYFVCETLPSFNQSGVKSATFKQIWRKSLKHTTLNNQQFIMDMFDVLTDIINLINIYVFYFDTYYICGITTFVGTGCLIFLLYVKWMLLKHSLLNNKIFNDIINFDLFTGSINAIQACIAFYILNQDEIEWNAIVIIKVILIAYLMLIKLGRVVSMCIVKTSEDYETKVKQTMLINTEKITSTSNEQVVTIESRDMEIEMAEYVNIAVNIESEESKENKSKSKSKESNEKPELNDIKMLTEINSFGNFDETNQLLMNLNKDGDFSVKYEDEWIKNVISLVKVNQKILRNKAMKPIVKEYMKSLEKQKGDDYVKFMGLLQNKKQILNDDDDEITIKC